MSNEYRGLVSLISTCKTVIYCWRKVSPKANTCFLFLFFSSKSFSITAHVSVERKLVEKIIQIYDLDSFLYLFHHPPLRVWTPKCIRFYYNFPPDPYTLLNLSCLVMIGRMYLEQGSAFFVLTLSNPIVQLFF